MRLTSPAVKNSQLLHLPVDHPTYHYQLRDRVYKILLSPGSTTTSDVFVKQTPLKCHEFKQAVREAAQYAPAPVRRTLQPSSSPYTPYACGAQRALLHEYS